jgi:GTP-binding protein
MNIITASFLISSPDWTKCPAPDKPEFAFIGRSNVGKSSLINMLCNKQQLAKTSATPGKTQLINHFLIESEEEQGPGAARKKRSYWYLADLPGYGYAKVAQGKRRQWQQMIEQYLRKRVNLMTVFVLIDARLRPQNIDLEFIRSLGEWKVPFALVFTKSDKTTQREVSAHVKQFLDTLREEWEYLPPHFVTSAVKHRGRKELLEFIKETCSS